MGLSGFKMGKFWPGDGTCIPKYMITHTWFNNYTHRIWKSLYVYIHIIRIYIHIIYIIYVCVYIYVNTLQALEKSMIIPFVQKKQWWDSSGTSPKTAGDSHRKNVLCSFSTIHCWMEVSSWMIQWWIFSKGYKGYTVDGKVWIYDFTALTNIFLAYSSDGYHQKHHMIQTQTYAMASWSSYMVWWLNPLNFPLTSH